MNLHTTQIQRKTDRKRTRTASRRSGSGNLALVLRIVALLVVIFLVASARAVLNSETEKLNRKAVTLKAKIHNFNRDIANLQIKQQQYHGRYILDQIKRLDLKLSYPKAGQVRKLKVAVSSREEMENAEIANLLLSQR